MLCYFINGVRTQHIMKLYLLLCSVLCITIAQAEDIRPPNGIIVPLPDGETPDLNCILFGNAGCQTTCALIGKLFVQAGAGSCNAKSICTCTLYEPPIIDQLWNSKFIKNKQSVALLDLIKKQRKYLLLKKVIAILKEPYLSNQRMRQLLIDSFSKEIGLLAEKLEPLPENKIIYRYVNMDKKFDKKNLSKLADFVKKELRALPKNVTDDVAQNCYKKRLREFLDNFKNKNTAPFVINQFKLIPDSSTIVEALKELKKKSTFFKEEDYDDENDTGIRVEREDRVPFQPIIDMIAASVTKRLITYSDEKWSNVAKINNSGNETTESKWKPAVKLVSDNEFSNGNVKREWTGDNTYIRYYKSAKTKQLSLEWHSGDTLINLYLGLAGEIEQSWMFGPVEITLSIDRQGNKEYEWNLGNTTLIYKETSTGEKTYEWQGEEDPEALMEYKNNIRSWCNQNVDLFPDKCVIFDD